MITYLYSQHAHMTNCILGWDITVNLFQSVWWNIIIIKAIVKRLFNNVFVVRIIARNNKSCSKYEVKEEEKKYNIKIFEVCTTILCFIMIVVLIFCWSHQY